jgi:hypothetical protein
MALFSKNPRSSEIQMRKGKNFLAKPISAAGEDLNKRMQESQMRQDTLLQHAVAAEFRQIEINTLRGL